MGIVTTVYGRRECRVSLRRQNSEISWCILHRTLDKRLILDGIKDHCISHVRGKRYAHEMWTKLTNLYQSTNENREMALKEKIEAH